MQQLLIEYRCSSNCRGQNATKEINNGVDAMDAETGIFIRHEL